MSSIHIYRGLAKSRQVSFDEQGTQGLRGQVVNEPEIRGSRRRWRKSGLKKQDWSSYMMVYNGAWARGLERVRGRRASLRTDERLGWEEGEAEVKWGHVSAFITALVLLGRCLRLLDSTYSFTQQSSSGVFTVDIVQMFIKGLYQNACSHTRSAFVWLLARATVEKYHRLNGLIHANLLYFLGFF